MTTMQQLEAENALLKQRLSEYESRLNILRLANENVGLMGKIRDIELELSIAACAAEYRVSVEQIKGRSRLENVSRARQFAMVIMRETGLSFTEVGILFGRDHGTVMHALRAVRNRADCMPTERDRFDRIRCTIAEVTSQERRAA